MSSNNRMEKLFFYQNIPNGNYTLVKYNQEGTLNNSIEEIKKVLEKVCNSLGGNSHDFGIELMFKKVNLPLSTSSVRIILEDHYEKGSIKPNGSEARIHIKRGLFSHKEKDLLKMIQDSLKKDYQIEVKPYS